MFFRVCFSVVVLVTLMCLPADASRAFIKQGKSIFVDNVWGGMPVGFSIVTYKDKQYIAYYDAERWMTVACRSLDSETWQKVRLDNQIGWDSHNYVVFAFDSDGQMHLSGNMHAIPLKYYRTTKPGDITTLTPINKMTGEQENRVTYPRFYTGPQGEFLFTYRDGGSGNGNNIVNVYNAKTKTWSRFSNKPLFDGQGLMNAYQSGPVRDKNGNYHITWVWRDTPACETNHDVSYAWSPGSLNNWQKSDGMPITLPMTIENTEILDHVQPGGGLLNNVKISFDADARPMVTYNKFDPKGRTQIYTMRLENKRWKRYQTTNWPDRWEFSGNGSIGSLISFSAPSQWDDTGLLYQTLTNHFQAPYQQIRFLDKRSLQPVGEPERLLPAGFDIPSPDKLNDWQVNLGGFSIGAIRQSGSAWVMRWESLKANRDKPRDFIPPPSRLELVELIRADQ